MIHNRILVIDDDRDVVVLLRHHLSRAGYEVLHALGGLEGLTMAVEETPDLVVSDILMPGFDGFGLLAGLRANETTSQLPVVFLSVLDDSTSLSRAKRAGIDGYLVKPVRREELLTMVSAKLRQDPRNLHERGISHLSAPNIIQ
jgi:DNA-binding response OmpR family regulator